MEKNIRLKYSSRTGHFNFANPSEESISCNMSVFDEEGTRIMNTNFKPEYEVEGDDVAEAIYLLEEADKGVLYSTSQKEWKEMISYLKENQEDIEDGNKKYKIKTIMEKIDRLQAELKSLNP